jgi:hypothetical protein
MIRGEMTNDEAGMTSDVWMRKRAGVGKGKGGMRGAHGLRAVEALALMWRRRRYNTRLVRDPEISFGC